MEQVLRLGFDEDAGAEGVEVLRLGAGDPALLIDASLGADDFVHDGLPGARGGLGIGGREVESRHLEIEKGLAERLVPGVEKGEGVCFVAGAEAGVPAGLAVFAVVTSRMPEQDIAMIHKRGQRVRESCARRSRSRGCVGRVGEDCRILAIREGTRRFTDSFSECDMKSLEQLFVMDTS